MQAQGLPPGRGESPWLQVPAGKSLRSDSGQCTEVLALLRVASGCFC